MKSHDGSQYTSAKISNGYISANVVQNHSVWFYGRVFGVSGSVSATFCSHVGKFKMDFSSVSSESLHIWFDAWVLGLANRMTLVGVLVLADNVRGVHIRLVTI